MATAMLWALTVLLGTSFVSSQTDLFTWDLSKPFQTTQPTTPGPTTPDVFTFDARTTTPTTTTPVPPTYATNVNVSTACRSHKAELVFLLDSSASEGANNFQEQLKFVQNVVNKFDIGPDAVQVSVVTYSTDVHNAFYLNEYKTKTDVLNAISNVPYVSGTTYTDKGLSFVLNESFSASHGARNDSNKILIVLTDGQSSNPVKTAEVANQLHNTDVRVLAIGIGSNIDSAELSTIATDNSRMFTVANFTALANIERIVAYRTCKTEGLLCSDAPTDILFLLDTSGSEGQANFQKQLEFVKNFVKDFTIGPTAVQVAVATFATTTQSEFWFKDYQNQTALLNAIDNVQYRSGNTHTELALKLGETAFTAANGARNSSNHIIIMLTDGQSTDKAQTKAEANIIHNAGTQVIAIGIGNSIDQEEIKNIASGNGNENAFSVANFEALKTIETEIQTRTCKVEKACKATDVIFLLDSSGSEGRSNFQKQLDFANNFVRDLNIGPNDIQVGVVTFSTTVHPQFNLNQHTNKADLEKAILAVPYQSGNTHTELGLKYVRENSFKPANGGRPNANQVVIVVTDGHPQSRASTAREATLVHQAGIKVISVGVGNNIDVTDLTDIASASELVYRVANFDALHTIEKQVIDSACKVKESLCKADPTDIVFLLDSSSSEGSDNFKKQIQFVNNFVNGFDIGPTAIQISLVTFSTSVQNRFFLGDYNNKAALKAAISRAPYIPGSTNTGSGLQFIRTTSFSPAHGARQNANKVVIVMTDGQSQQASVTAQQAQLLKDDNVTVIAVGIGNGVNQQELQSISSDKGHVFTVASFNALSSIQSELQKKTCSKLGCASKAAEVVFVLDSSSSEGSTNFKKQLTFVNNFISNFEVSPTEVQFAAVTFSTNTYPGFNLNTYSSKAPLMAAVSALQYHSGVTYTHKALQYVQSTILQPANGLRPNTPQIVIVLTDGQASNRQLAHSEAAKLRAAGVEVLAVGIGNGINTAELTSLATDSKHAFAVANFDALHTIQKELEKATCSVHLAPTTAPLTKSGQCSSTDKADVIFLVDAGSAVGQTNFQKELQFVSSVINGFTVGPNNVQFGLIKYHRYAQPQFYLNSYPSKSSLLLAVPRTRLGSGRGFVNNALSLAYSTMLTTRHGSRLGVPQFVIAITDAQSPYPQLIKRYADQLKATGVKLFSIGVGSGVSQTEVESIATDKTHVLSATDFDGLQALVQQIHDMMCTDSGYVSTTTPAPTKSTTTTAATKSTAKTVPPTTTTTEPATAIPLSSTSPAVTTEPATALPLSTTPPLVTFP